MGSKTITEKTLESKPSRRSMFAGKPLSAALRLSPMCCQSRTIVSGVGHGVVSTLSMSLRVLQGICRRSFPAARCRFACALV